jgi:hypothetical protein
LFALRFQPVTGLLSEFIILTDFKMLWLVLGALNKAMPSHANWRWTKPNSPLRIKI